MPEARDCPERSDLERLLTGTLPAESLGSVTLHVESCAHCQRTLEQLAGTSWEEEARRLGPAQPPSPELRQVIRQVLLPGSEEVTQAGSLTGTDDLSFLLPSSRPGSMGRLGHYEIQEVIGQGGFGIVLKAFDEKLHRVVAVKVLSPELAASGTACKRFIREAQAAAAIKNEHVVSIYNVEDEHRPPYLVMDLGPNAVHRPGKQLSPVLLLPPRLRVAGLLLDGIQGEGCAAGLEEIEEPSPNDRPQPGPEGAARRVVGEVAHGAGDGAKDFLRQVGGVGVLQATAPGQPVDERSVQADEQLPRRPVARIVQANEEARPRRWRVGHARRSSAEEYRRRRGV